MIPRQSQPLAVHDLWRRVYDYSRATFEKIPDYFERDSQLTAHAARLGHFHESGRRRAPRRPIKMPKLGPIAQIGELRALWSVDADGQIDHTTIADWSLVWSPSLQACAGFPKPLALSERARAPRVLDRVLKTWAEGRGVRWSRVVELPEPRLCAGVPLLAIEYSSDKFSHGRPRRYIHHCEPGVVLRVSQTQTKRGEPSAVLVRGGALRLTADGLEG